MIWCKHKWETKVKETLPSAWEQVAVTTDKAKISVEVKK